jgi:hypothetical protein
MVQAGVDHLIGVGDVAGIDGCHCAPRRGLGIGMAGMTKKYTPLTTHDATASIAPGGLDTEAHFIEGMFIEAVAQLAQQLSVSD